MTHIRSTLLGSIVLATALAVVAPAAHADSQSVSCTQTMVDRLGEKGYRLRSYDTDSLYQGQTMSYDVTLQQNVTYAVVACGDYQAYDVDIYLYDESGHLIDRDTDRSRLAVVTVTPAWTGPFTVIVKMYSARGRADYTTALMYNW